MGECVIFGIEGEFKEDNFGLRYIIFNKVIESIAQFGYKVYIFETFHFLGTNWAEIKIGFHLDKQ